MLAHAAPPERRQPPHLRRGRQPAAAGRAAAASATSGTRAPATRTSPAQREPAVLRRAVRRPRRRRRASPSCSRWAGLDDAARRPVRTYSRGMAQRLALARALLHGPELLLLDEPFSGLDPAGTTRSRRCSRELRAAGHAIVLSTHDIDARRTLATRVAILHRGRIAWTQDGAADAVVARGGLRHRRHGTGLSARVMLRGALAVLRKDLRIEWRTRESLASFVVARRAPGRRLQRRARSGAGGRAALAPSVLWATFVFTGLLGVQRGFLLERENDCLGGLLRVADRSRRALPRQARVQRGAARRHAGARRAARRPLPARRRRPRCCRRSCSCCCSATWASRRWRRCSPP